MDSTTRENVVKALRNAAETLDPVSAAGNTEADALAERIKAEILKVFPNAGVSAQFSSGIAPSITVYFTLQGDHTKHVNRIAENDPAYSIFHIWGVGKDGSVPDRLTAEITVGASLTVEKGPDSPRYLAYDSVKFGWRKKSGNADAIVKHFGRYFGKVKRVVKDNFDRLPKGFDSRGLGLGG